MTERRTRVLLLASTFPAEPGDGTPEFVGDLAVELAKTMDVRILVPSVPDAPTRSTYRGVDIYRFRFFPRRWEDLADGAILENIRGRRIRALQIVPFFVSEIYNVARHIRSFKPDVIHAFWIIPQGLSAFVVNRKIPVLLTTLGGDLYALVDTPLRGLITRIVKHAKHTTVMNAQMKGEVERLGIDPFAVSVEPMGADLSGIVPHDVRETDTVEILFVGRLVEKKGLRHLIAALKDVETNYRLTVIGHGPLEEELKQLADGMPVSFVGEKPKTELRACYSSADMIILPSVRAASGDQDGLPVVLLESLASGLPTIASDLPGIDTVVSHRKTGLLVTPGDEAALTRAIDELAADTELRRTLSEAGKDRAADRSVVAVGERYAPLLKKIAGMR
ncbi:MAG: glycosyltransferase [Flaviflexus sp.]|uniref:glycosyltransferase n=1 Tax=Flaviflexus sp. TaxID=1969482 RepID=UPI003F9169AC